MVKISYPKEIQSFFDEIVEEIKKVLNPDYILIAGSFGKGTWLYDNGYLLSDFEFEFICTEKWSLKKKKALLEKLNNLYAYEISLKGHLLKNVKNKVSSNYSNKYPGYLRLNFYDAFSNPQILYAKSKVAINLNLRAKEIPAWEGWRLYINRVGDILSLQLKNANNIEKQNYYWLKMFESIADAYLIVNNLYSKSISIRFNLFTEDLLKKDPILSKSCVESYETVKVALYARKQHELNNFDFTVLGLSKKNKIIASWLKYFEEKVLIEEGYTGFNALFSNIYVQNRSIQKKYLEVNSSIAIQISNLIRLFFNYRSLLKLKFKIFNMKVSWRHTILIVISELFKEQINNKTGFVETRNILVTIISKKKLSSLSDRNLIETVLKLWKILR